MHLQRRFRDVSELSLGGALWTEVCHARTTIGGHTGHRKDGDSARLRTEIEIGTN